MGGPEDGPQTRPQWPRPASGRPLIYVDERYEPADAWVGASDWPGSGWFEPRRPGNADGPQPGNGRRLEAGGVGAALTTLHRVAEAADLELKIDLRRSA